jgi:NADPH:quinone reductase-like Zn-dependent oxidoreductase
MNSLKMKAMVSTKYGSPEIFQLQSVEKPTPKDNEVLVKIHAASVTTAETMMRTGYPLIGRLFMGLTKPKNAISGTGFSGVIESLGNEVSQFKVGDQVFGESLESFGTYAQFVCVDAKGIIALKPDNISHEEAATVGDGPITSWNFLKNLAEIKTDQSILIIGASGSLGTAAVQLAKNFGANVTGVCSTRNIELVKSLGANKVIDYTTTDINELGNQYDIIYDTIGISSFYKSKKLLTEKGIYMSPVLNFSLLIQMIWTSFLGQKKAKFSATGMLPVSSIRTYLQEIKKMIVNGRLKSIIDKRYALGETADAHRYIDEGHKVGNVVLVLVK